MLTPLPRLPRLPRLPGASSKKLYLAVFYHDFGTFARKNEAHFLENLIIALGDPRASQRDPPGCEWGVYIHIILIIHIIPIIFIYRIILITPKLNPSFCSSIGSP